jgi:CBS domain-containing protein
MRLAETMSAPVEVIGVSALAAEARRLLRERGIHHVVVLDGRQVAGVVSSHDLDGEAGAGVANVMSRRVVTASPRTTVREAANLLRGHAAGCLPIVERGRLVGIVTISDLLTLLGRGAARPTGKSTRWTLKSRGPRRKAIEASRVPLRA